MANRCRNNANRERLYFWDSKITADGDCSHEVRRHLLLGRKVMTNLDSTLKSRDIINEGPYCQSYDFSSSYVLMWELDYKESWALKNWCFWTLMLEETLESPLDSKKIQSVHLKGNQSWIFIGRTDAETETRAIWFKELTHLKKPWCWERLKAGGERDGRGWNGWMASLTQWTWVRASSGCWWWSEKPGVLQSKGSQRVGYDLATELNWTEGMYMISTLYTHQYFLCLLDYSSLSEYEVLSSILAVNNSYGPRI